MSLDHHFTPKSYEVVVARRGWNPSEGGDRGGLETRVASAILGDPRWPIPRSTLCVRIAEFTNKELRTGREMYMRLF